ncbi:MAG: MarR family transcriptional regulator [Hyphomicrobiaceae bacterium]|nr:MarR family transcriptional regulator [Hyphomicrobiaceae bacterium]
MAKKARVFVASGSTIHLLHRAGQLADEAFLSALGRDGITARQFIVLDIVAREDNPSQTTICELSGIDRSTLADIVRRLVSRGLLARKRTREDARRYAVRVTDAGQKVLETATGVARQVEDTVVGVLPASQRGDFQNALRMMVEKLLDRQER